MPSAVAPDWVACDMTPNALAPTPLAVLSAPSAVALFWVACAL